MSLYDVEASNRSIAENIWDNTNDWRTSEALCFSLIDDIVHPIENVRIAASLDLSHAVKQSHRKITKDIVDTLLSKYDEQYEEYEANKRNLAAAKVEQLGKVRIVLLNKISDRIKNV